MPNPRLGFEYQELQRALLFARMEAVRLSAAEITPPHVLLGLLRQKSGLTNRLLAHLTLQEMQDAIPRGAEATEAKSNTDVPYSADTERVIAWASAEAERDGRSHAGPEYLLLALLREGAIAELLRPRGVTFEVVRTAIDARQQKPFVLTVIDSPAPDLSFVRYDPAIHQEFAGMLAKLPLRGAADHAAILTNLAEQPVTAMVARWTVIDPAGVSRVRDVTYDDYEPRLPSRQSLEPGGRRLVTMAGFHPAFDVSRPHAWVSAGREGLEDDAAEIRVSLDSAVFADGRLVGRDEYGIGDHLHGRYLTAKDLVEQIDRTVAAGEDVEALLTSMARKASSRWWWILASQGRSAIKGGPTGNQRYESWLDSLRTIPKPPQLFR